ncbi:MAG: VPS10 domain-containing protein, partial [Bacteroidota bacterium]
MKKLLYTAIFFIITVLSYAQTASWTAYKPALFPTNASGQIHGISRVSQMKFHPSNSLKMYAVSARGGLFISNDGGNNWLVAPGCDNLTLNTRFASVCIDHVNDQVIYLGGGDHNYYSSGSGVWKSTNGGSSFSQTTLTGKIVVDMIMDPSNNNIIVAATNTGVYKTTDAGATWTLKSASLALDDLKQKASNGSRTLFVSTRNAELYRSDDFGDTWIQVTSGIFIPTGYTTGGGTRIAVTPADTNVVYFYMNAQGGTLFKSTDGGNNFTAVKNNISPFLTGYTNSSADPGQGDYNTGLGVDRANANIVYFVAHNVWKSTDGGVTWTQLTVWYQKVHTDMHQIVTSPYNNSQLWNMNDGGVWLSTDGGNNWTPKSDGIYGYEIYHGSCSPTRRDMMSIGTQDNGELYANSTTWYTNRGGDWQSHCVFDYRANSSMVYYFLPDWGTVQLPRRRLVTGSTASYGLPASVTDFSDIAFFRGNPDLAFVGDTVVLRTTNLTLTTPSWTSIYNTGVKIMAMHVNFADSNKLYVITSDQKIHISTNALSATPTFTVVSLPNATSTSASITSVKSSPNTIYISTNTRVYRSADNGLTWTAVTYNLPSYNHAAIIADEYFSSNELVFVASGGSVYYKTASATSWSIYSSSLPSRTTIVDMSIFNDGTSNTLLRVFTYGRGVWETPINNLRTTTANFVADNTSPCIGQPVNFSDLSTGTVVSRSWSFPGGTPSTSASTNPVVTYASPGRYDVTLTVSNGTTSSTKTVTSYISTLGVQLPVSEGFESGAFPPSGWINVDAGNNGSTWQLKSGAGGFGTSASCMFFDNYGINTAGAFDEFRSSTLDLTPYASANLKFDLAYQQYSTSTYIDSLQILVSTDCGTTFSSVYLKFGAALATVTGTNTAAFTPTSAQWRTESINMNAFLGQNVIIAFRNIGRYGNNIHID